MNALLSFFLVSLCGISYALTIPVVARSPVPRTHGGRTAVLMQQLPSGVRQNVENARDIVYATNITIGGQEVLIQLDTGSADLWVMPPEPINTNQVTEIETNLTYGIGRASGHVAFAPVTFGPYSVDNQAFLLVDNATDFGAIQKNNISGILGLAFDLGSQVFINTIVATNDTTTARPFLSNIFRKDPTSPNMFTVLLGRDYDRDGPQEGAFTIGEYVDGYEHVAEMPKLYRTPWQRDDNATHAPHWSVVLDSMTVNGQKFQFNKSNVADVEEGKQVVVLDTGFTYSQIPRAAVDFIYSSIPGAWFNETRGLWHVPCMNTTELSFEFGNTTIPVHPLDITTVTTNGNETICVNSYRPFNLALGANTGIDFILGDSFLKNVYAAFDYGDWTPDNSTADIPFIQLLPTTDGKDAMTEFGQVRPKQVRKSESALLGQTGSIATHDALEIGLQRVEKPLSRPIEKRNRMVIYTTAHMNPVYRAMAGCVNHVADNYGPVVLALMIGSVAILVSLCVVGTVLGVRMWVRNRRAAEGYEEVGSEAKEDVVIFDQSSRSHHYAATTYHDAH